MTNFKVEDVIVKITCQAYMYMSEGALKEALKVLILISTSSDKTNCFEFLAQDMESIHRFSVHGLFRLLTGDITHKDLDICLPRSTALLILASVYLEVQEKFQLWQGGKLQAPSES